MLIFPILALIECTLILNILYTKYHMFPSRFTLLFTYNFNSQHSAMTMCLDFIASIHYQIIKSHSLLG